MAAEAIQILRLYFESRGLGSDPHEWPKDAPLIARLPSEAKFKDGVPLTDSAVAKLLAAFLEDVAMSATDTEFAGRLRRASAHWMRHSFGTHAAETMDLAIVRDWLGHASLSTTSMYINTERAKRHEAAKAFFAA